MVRQSRVNNPRSAPAKSQDGDALFGGADSHWTSDALNIVALRQGGGSCVSSASHCQATSSVGHHHEYKMMPPQKRPTLQRFSVELRGSLPT